MNDNLLQDLEDARSLLEAFEAETDHIKRSRDFEDAIDILNDCLSAKIDESLKTIAGNLKLTYTRKLLENISELPTVDIDIWFQYTKLFFLKVPDEVKLIIHDNPELGNSYFKFVNLWRKKAIEILSNVS